jgi:hypothetical protein
MMTGRMNHLVYQTHLQPDWEKIEQLRQAVKLSLEVFKVGPELAEGLAMVTAELLENAVKHAAKSTLGYRLEVTDAGGRITVRNHVAPDDPHLARIAETLDRLRDGAKDGYMMQQLYVSEGEDAGLGLARIVYEARCRLEQRVDRERQLLDMIATFGTPTL